MCIWPCAPCCWLCSRRISPRIAFAGTRGNTCAQVVLRASHDPNIPDLGIASHWNQMFALTGSVWVPGEGMNPRSKLTRRTHCAIGNMRHVASCLHITPATNSVGGTHAAIIVCKSRCAQNTIPNTRTGITNCLPGPIVCPSKPRLSYGAIVWVRDRTSRGTRTVLLAMCSLCLEGTKPYGDRVIGDLELEARRPLESLGLWSSRARSFFAGRWKSTEFDCVRCSCGRITAAFLRVFVRGRVRKLY